ncbi:MAG TPA: GNAT family N-acetyltransferase [Baekduia sp.]
MIVVEHHASIAALARDWERLADRAHASPFQRPGWITAWATAFAGGHLDVLAARRDGELCGVLPTVRRAGVVRSAANAHTPAADVLAEDDATVAALLAAVYATRPKAVALTHLADPTAARAAARTARYRLAERPLPPAPYLDVHTTLDDYLRPRRRLMADLRRRRRRLQEQGDRVTLDHDGTLDELLALEALGWKGARRSAIAARPSTLDFYTNITKQAAARDTLRIFTLRLDGRPLAALLALEDNHVLHLLKTGFDPTFARFSPGQTVLAAAIAHAHDAGLGRVELGQGTEPYKLVWTDTTTQRVALTAYAPKPLADLAWATAAHGRPLAQRAGLDRLLRPGRDRLLALYDVAQQRLRGGPTPH